MLDDLSGVRQGEFRGDFSRDTFDPMNNYSRVLMQQGRVLLDADWNEQTSILLHYMRSFTSHLIGPYGGTPNWTGETDVKNRPDFRIDIAGSELLIEAGSYYVGGILSHNPTTAKYSNLTKENPLPEGNFLVYLDVWERHITDIDNEHIREKALHGVNTASRAEIVWQIRLENKHWDENGAIFDIPEPAEVTDWKVWIHQNWGRWLDRWQPKNPGQLKAKISEDAATSTEVCIASPDAGYRGENQLYRVEIHKSQSFKWSRDNSIDEFLITLTTDDPEKKTFTGILENTGRDDLRQLQAKDIVEYLDDKPHLRDEGKMPILLEVDLDPVLSQVKLKKVPNLPDGTAQGPEIPVGRSLRCRRWNGQGKIEADAIVKLDSGLQIQFITAYGDSFRSGDYWLIPARSVIDGLEWPGEAAVKPHGVKHAYAPLAVVTRTNGTMAVVDCRHFWNYIAT